MKQGQVIARGSQDGVKPIQAMFAQCAERYDLVNSLASWGRDRAWRREAVRIAQVPDRGIVLDVATGTGSLARELARRTERVVGVDFCLPMLERARARGLMAKVRFLMADARQLPFPSDTFDCVTSGFALRHMPNLPQDLAELCRVLKPGGVLVCLELARPRSRLFRLLYWPYFSRLVPWLGECLSGQPEPYKYLPRSVASFSPVEEVSRMMLQAGFREVRYKSLHLGAISLHWGRK